MANDDALARLQRLAKRRGQRGYFTSAQAQAAGMSRTRLSRLVERGLILRVARRVYRFRVAAATDWKDELAIELLATGGSAAGLSAAALYDLADPPTIPSVLVERGSRTAINGRHTSRDLSKHERVTVDGLRSLSPLRAVLDSAHLLPATRARTMVESAIVRGLVKPESLRRRAQELTHSKRPGCAVVLRILADLHPELARSRNEWEALVARRAKEFGLPRPQLEYEVCFDGRRYIVDAAWPEQRVALEFDGRDPHMRRAVHDNDTGRRNDFTDAGWRRYGITATALKARDDRAFGQVARAIRRR
ncbi:MAG: hypothetical protein QOH10_2333 [Actinomycetota bacterium]|nr:hypothetical protein [Actinomycetota bacterium]